MPLLELDGVSSGYTRGNVLTEVSLHVPPGAIVAIIGPNGHGKSTLLRTISGLLKCRSGRIVLDGEAISGLPPHLVARRGIAHVPQGDLLFPQMTVHENLLMGAYCENDRHEVERRFQSVCRLFPKVETLRSKVVRALSGGERRMVGIGRGLMAASKLMLIDEPSLGLAPIVIDQVYDAICAIRKGGTAIVVVEENPERAVRFADYIYLLDNGRIKWHGGPADFRAAGRELISTYFGG